MFLYATNRPVYISTNDRDLYSQIIYKKLLTVT